VEHKHFQKVFDQRHPKFPHEKKFHKRWKFQLKRSSDAKLKTLQLGDRNPLHAVVFTSTVVPNKALSLTHFGLRSVRVPKHVTTRKTQRRIHAGDRQRSSHGLYPSRSYNADRAGLVDLELCMRRAAAEVVVNQHRT
jgi:hypothetical protein